MLKISIITVCYNSEKYLESAILSVLNQSYPNIEYIIVDGASKDNTLKIIDKYKAQIAKVVSEPDKGIYDAMNKGYKLATGDVIGILNSDDFLSSNDIVAKLATYFESSSIEAIYGDIQFVKPDDLNKVVRYYSSRFFRPWLFRLGMMPPHASFYAKKGLFENMDYIKQITKLLQTLTF